MSKIIFNGVDYAGGSGNYFNPVIYSDVERVIGVWRDNKPLYQKTIQTGNLPNNSSMYVSTPSNIENLVHYSGFMYSTNTPSSQRPLPFSAGGVNDVRVDLDGGVIRITDYANWSTYNAYLTVQYTKTTDVAGSGDYNTYGVPTVHYSTNEQVIGTWIDGKPIYQITLTNLQLVTMSGTVFNHGIANLDECIRIFGRCKYNNTGEMLPLPYTSNNMSYMIYVGNVTPTTFDIGCGNGFSSLQDISVTLQYTKTTD